MLKRASDFHEQNFPRWGKFCGRREAQCLGYYTLTQRILSLHRKFLRFELHVVEPLVEAFLEDKLIVGTLLDYLAKVENVDRGCVFDGT